MASIRVFDSPGFYYLVFQLLRKPNLLVLIIIMLRFNLWRIHLRPGLLGKLIISRG